MFKNFKNLFKNISCLTDQEKIVWVNRKNNVSVDELIKLGVKCPYKVVSNINKKLKTNLRFKDKTLYE